MNLIFMGTPEFAVPSLEELSLKHNILAVVSQPDKARGRGKKQSFSPVKQAALNFGCPVFQPEILDDTFFTECIEPLPADVIVVVAYGKILPVEILKHAKYGCINVHASLLPKYRGAAPIHHAVLNGEKVTGVCTMLMDEGLDTGDVLLSKTVDLPFTATTGDMYELLSKEGAKLISETLSRLDKIVPSKQEGEGSYASVINKETARVNWNRSSMEIYNLVRAMLPKPAAYSRNGGKMFKIHWGQPSCNCPDIKLCDDNIMGSKNGQIIKICDEGVYVKCGGDHDFFCITRIQPENSKPMHCLDYLRGNKFVSQFFE